MSAVTYYRRKAAGQCTGCGGPERVPGFFICTACREKHRQQSESYADRVRAPHLVTWHQVKPGLPLRLPTEPAPLQQIGCCGGMHAILRNPLRTACCGRVLSLEQG